MRKVISVLLLLAATSIFGQSDYVVTIKGDTLWGKVSLLRSTVYDVVIVKNEKEKTRIKSFFIDHLMREGKKYVNIQYGNKQMFAVEKATGALSYYLIRLNDDYEFTEKLLVKSPTETLMVPTVSFRKYVSAFLSDCDSVSKKIRKRTLRLPHLQLIIDQYNKDCAAIKE